MTAEQWRPVAGAHAYDVSDLGRVRSRARSRGGSEPRILRQSANVRSGYLQVALMLDTGARRTSAVHTLVARAFLGPRPEGHQVRHLNGDQTDNRQANLQYGTAGENIRDQVSHGTHPMASRTHCKHGHEYTPENTFVRTNAGKVFRDCLTCKRTRGLATYHRRANTDRGAA